MGSGKTRFDGVVDVGILVLSHCENPAKNEALDFLEKVLTMERPSLIPMTAFLGAYHIMTRYLGIKEEEAAEELYKTASLDLEIFFQDITVDLIEEALTLAPEFDIEGWDAYLVSVARKHGIRKIYTIDKRLAKVPDMMIVIPISRETLDKYHKWVSERLSLDNHA